MKRAHQALHTKRSHPALRKERAPQNNAKSHQTVSTPASATTSQTKKTSQAKKPPHPMKPIAERLVSASPQSSSTGQRRDTTCRKARHIKQKTKTHKHHELPH
jgi:hypothetical protein